MSPSSTVCGACSRPPSTSGGRRPRREDHDPQRQPGASLSHRQRISRIEPMLIARISDMHQAAG